MVVQVCDKSRRILFMSATDFRGHVQRYKSFSLPEFHGSSNVRALRLPLPFASTSLLCTPPMGRYPWAEFILFQILRILVFYPTRLYAYRAIVFTAMVVLASKIYRTTETTDPVTLSYLVGVATAFHLTFTTYVLCTGGSFPDRWRRVRDGDLPETDDNSPLDFPLKKKLWWMFDIAHSARMIGWVQEPQGCLPRRPSPSRRTFLRETFLKLVFNMVIVDLSGSICSRSPRYDYRFPRNSTHGLRPAFAVPPLLRHAPHVIAFAVVAAASVAMFYNITSLVAVGVFRSSPTLWPDMWGNMGDGYTLRKFWGYVR